MHWRGTAPGINKLRTNTAIDFEPRQPPQQPQQRRQQAAAQQLPLLWPRQRLPLHALREQQQLRRTLLQQLQLPQPLLVLPLLKLLVLLLQVIQLPQLLQRLQQLLLRPRGYGSCSSDRGLAAWLQQLINRSAAAALPQPCRSPAAALPQLCRSSSSCSGCSSWGSCVTCSSSSSFPQR